MKPVDLPSGSQRNSNSGLLVKEVYNDNGTFNTWLLPQQTFRVSAGTGDVTVSIDGVLAATLRKGEVEWFNVGMGWRSNERAEIEVEIVGDSRVQVVQASDFPQRPMR